jgi:iron complex transport system substrate-binding protein
MGESMLKTKKIVCRLMIAVLTPFLFLACSQKRNDAGNIATREVVDMLVRTVAVPKTVNKVFVDWASGVTLVMTLNATDKLIAVMSAFQSSDIFAWARIICPSIENVPFDDTVFTNIEAVLGYEPDLVVTNIVDNIEKYANVGLPVIYVSYNDSTSFRESMRIVGSALGEKELEAAEKYNKYFNDNVALVSGRTASIPDAGKQGVYYADSRFNDAYHTVGNGEIQESWITIAGGKLATAGHFEGRDIQITAEKFLEIAPDIILVGAQNQAAVSNMIKNDSVLAELEAVKNGQVLRIPQGIFPWCRTGPETTIQFIWAGKLLHPDLFEDIDIATVAQDFYRGFYGTNVSDEYITKILEGKLTPDSE